VVGVQLGINLTCFVFFRLDGSGCGRLFLLDRSRLLVSTKSSIEYWLVNVFVG
jgi:hypothetical protein